MEALFAELKNQIGLRRLRLRRLKFVREQFFLAAVAQNIKRLVRFLSQPQRRLCRPPLSRTETRKPATACSHMQDLLLRDFFNTHACYQQLRIGVHLRRFSMT